MRDVVRLPNGRINNCAVANNHPAKECQMCDGTCPDTTDVNAETEPPPEQEPFADFPCDFPGCTDKWKEKVVATIETGVGTAHHRKWTDTLYLCHEHAE